MKIYVGNLSRDISEDELKKEFAAFGAVDSVTLIKTNLPEQRRGSDLWRCRYARKQKAAIAGLNDKEVKERKMVVNEARPTADRKSNDRGRGGFGDRGNRSKY